MLWVTSFVQILKAVLLADNGFFRRIGNQECTHNFAFAHLLLKLSLFISRSSSWYSKYSAEMEITFWESYYWSSFAVTMVRSCFSSTILSGIELDDHFWRKCCCTDLLESIKFHKVFFKKTSLLKKNCQWQVVFWKQVWVCWEWLFWVHLSVILFWFIKLKWMVDCKL